MGVCRRLSQNGVKLGVPLFNNLRRLQPIDLRKTMQIQTLPKALMAAAIGSLFAVGASSAFAQDTADLAVRGTIVPGACAASFTGRDTVDFGTIKTVSLCADTYTRLKTQLSTLTATCATDHNVHLSVADQQSASKIGDADMINSVGLGTSVSSANQLFGLGTVTVNGRAINLGSYAVEVRSPRVDGTALNILSSTDKGGTWSNAGTSRSLHTTNTYSLGSGDKLTPVQGKVFTFPIGVMAALNYGSELQVTEDTKLNGQAVFNISYQ